MEGIVLESFEKAGKLIQLCVVDLKKKCLLQVGCGSQVNVYLIEALKLYKEPPGRIRW